MFITSPRFFRLFTVFFLFMLTLKMGYSFNFYFRFIFLFLPFSFIFFTFYAPPFKKYFFPYMTLYAIPRGGGVFSKKYILVSLFSMYVGWKILRADIRRFKNCGVGLKWFITWEVVQLHVPVIFFMTAARSVSKSALDPVCPKRSPALRILSRIVSTSFCRFRAVYWLGVPVLV